MEETFHWIIADNIRRELFRRAMRGEWQKVVEIYKNYPIAYDLKITNSGDTALHLAASDGQEVIVEKLVSIMLEEDPVEAKKALSIANEKEENTPLHVAASLGSARMCRLIAIVDPLLAGARNSDSETPLFLAVRHGKKQAFRCLQYICGPDLGRQYYRNDEGDTILHAAIAGEYLGTLVSKLKVEEPDLSCADVSNGTTEPRHPKNYDTCMYLFSLVRRAIKVVIRPTERCRGDAENQRDAQHARNQFIPSRDNTCFDFLKFVNDAMLAILGLGSKDLKNMIKEKKEMHVWSAQITNELLNRASLYVYDVQGRHLFPLLEEAAEESETDQEHGTRGMTMDMPRHPEMPVLASPDSPMLIAAKNGITEMVEIILERFPVPIHDKNAEKKNVVLLAAEQRQLDVYELLLKEKQGQDSDGTAAKDIAFRQVDDKGNSALHLAAALGDYKPWLIPAAALQMQWEIKWYEESII